MTTFTFVGGEDKPSVPKPRTHLRVEPWGHHV